LGFLVFLTFPFPRETQNSLLGQKSSLAKTPQCNSKKTCNAVGNYTGHFFFFGKIQISLFSHFLSHLGKISIIDLKSISYQARMGVYIFASLYANWIKLGSAFTDPEEPTWSPYRRMTLFRGRHPTFGLYSTRYPEELRDKVSPRDLDLIHWWPSLTIKDEISIQLVLRRQLEHCGEWYHLADLQKVLQVVNVFQSLPFVVPQEHKDRWLDRLDLEQAKMREEEKRILSLPPSDLSEEETRLLGFFQAEPKDRCWKVCPPTKKPYPLTKEQKQTRREEWMKGNEERMRRKEDKQKKREERMKKREGRIKKREGRIKKRQAKGKQKVFTFPGSDFVMYQAQ